MRQQAPAGTTAIDAAAGWPAFDPEMVEAAAGVIRSGRVNYWTGPHGKAFEAEAAKAFESRHAVALANGSVALELALAVVGIGPGDEVIVTPRSFVASASCVLLRGARPVFADVDRDSGNVTAATIERTLTPKTRAILPVHLGGWPCDMDAILDLARSRNLHVIEDVAQATGGRWKGRPLGSFGTVNAFSFCQDKIITTAGEGGLVTTNDETLLRHAWSMKDHGKDYEEANRHDPPPGFRWLHHDLGTNWRMTEVQAAVGRIALKRLDGWLECRRRNAAILGSRLSELPALRIPAAPDGHAWYRFYAYVRPEALKSGWSRDRILSEVTTKGVPCFTGSCSEIYRERLFSDRGLAPSEPLPIARELGETSLALLVHPTLTVEHMQAYANAVIPVVRAATR